MSLRERAVLFLQLREQPHVLDGDDGLIGEGFEEIDLLVCKRSRCLVRDGDQTQGVVSSHHGHHQAGAVAAQPGVLDVLRRRRRVVLDIREMKDAALVEHLRDVILGAERHGELDPESLDSLRGDAVSRGHPHRVSVDDEERAAVRAA